MDPTFRSGIINCGNGTCVTTLIMTFDRVYGDKKCNAIIKEYKQRFPDKNIQKWALGGLNIGNKTFNTEGCTILERRTEEGSGYSITYF